MRKFNVSNILVIKDLANEIAAFEQITDLSTKNAFSTNSYYQALSVKIDRISVALWVPCDPSYTTLSLVM